MRSTQSSASISVWIQADDSWSGPRSASCFARYPAPGEDFEAEGERAVHGDTSVGRR